MIKFFWWGCIPDNEPTGRKPKKPNGGIYKYSVTANTADSAPLNLSLDDLVTITSKWKCNKPLPTTYKVFFHKKGETFAFLTETKTESELLPVLYMIDYNNYFSPPFVDYSLSEHKVITLYRKYIDHDTHEAKYEEV